MPGNSERARLVEAIKREAPRVPGVYLFFDRAWQTLYIGKSVRLRDRLLSYFAEANFAPLPPDREGRLQRLVCHIAEFALRPTETELLALLLEDILIKRVLPPYNVRQREHGQYCYLELSDDAYPCLKVVEAGGPLDGTVFGPFRDRFQAAEIVRFVGRTCGLRACTDARPQRNCANGDLGLCLGPCREERMGDEYARAVRQAADFLGGDDTAVRAWLETEMVRRAEALEFERAAEARAQIGYWSSFCARQRFVQRFRAGGLAVREEGYTYRFAVDGTLAVEATTGAPSVPPELTEPLGDPRWVLDRAVVVYEWLQRGKGEMEV